jgi:hypothetical protein
LSIKTKESCALISVLDGLNSLVVEKEESKREELGGIGKSF